MVLGFTHYLQLDVFFMHISIHTRDLLNFPEDVK
nr:MAG TPA: hypothetical protein [Caudoviricetes sp.]